MRNETANNELNINDIWRLIVPAVFLIILIQPLIRGESAYHKVEGEIVSSFQGRLQYHIRLNTSENFYNINRSNIDIFREKAPVGGTAIIWYKREINYRGAGQSGFIIQKMIVNNEIIIPLGNSVNVFLASVIVLFLAGYIIYIVKRNRSGNVYK